MKAGGSHNIDQNVVLCCLFTYVAFLKIVNTGTGG